jgi:protein O-mannosyl-transferase
VALEPESATLQVGLGKAYARKGRLDEAIIHFQKTLEVEPADVEAQYDIGLSLIQAGRFDEAIIHLQKALEIEPDFAETQDSAVNNNFAWSLATNPDATKRNGALAVKLAEAACRKTHYQATIMVGTLAAAYAEVGRFDDAIKAAQQACSLASQSGDRKLLQKNQELLALYLKHQPYRESQANVSK